MDATNGAVIRRIAAQRRATPSYGKAMRERGRPDSGQGEGPYDETLRPTHPHAGRPRPPSTQEGLSVMYKAGADPTLSTKAKSSSS